MKTIWILEIGLCRDLVDVFVSTMTEIKDQGGQGEVQEEDGEETSK